jgi:hypothetical protein
LFMKLLDQVRDVIRKKHYSIRTEQAYVNWIRQYILFHKKRHPKDMGEKNWIDQGDFGLMERARRSDDCNDKNRGWPCSIRYVRWLWVESWMLKHY